MGYDNATVAAVQSLLLKERLKRNADAQCLEDVVCLVFLENYLADFAPQYDEQKVLGILRKTWNKMSPKGQATAKQVALPPLVRALLNKALSAP